MLSQSVTYPCPVRIKFEKMNGETFESIMNGTYVEPVEELEEISEEAVADENLSDDTNNNTDSTTDVE